MIVGSVVDCSRAGNESLESSIGCIPASSYGEEVDIVVLRITSIVERSNSSAWA